MAFGVDCMEILISESGATPRRKGMGFILGKMEIAMKVSGRRV